MLATLQNHAWELLGEGLGTFVVVLASVGSLMTAALTNSLHGVFQVGFTTAGAMAAATFLASTISPGHLNPAITLAYAAFRRKDFHWAKVVPYFVVQCLGGAVAALLLLAVWGGFIRDFEDRIYVERGAYGSEKSAVLFAGYFPNPLLFGYDKHTQWLSVRTACVIEAMGACVLTALTFLLTDTRNRPLMAAGSLPLLAPILVACAYAALWSTFVGVTLPSFNPARDLGPRYIAWLAGWRDVAMPGPRGEVWVFLLAPLAGGLLGGALYTHVLARRVLALSQGMLASVTGLRPSPSSVELASASPSILSPAQQHRQRLVAGAPLLSSAAGLSAGLAAGSISLAMPASATAAQADEERVGLLSAVGDKHA